MDWNEIALFDDYLDSNVAAPYKNQPLAQDWARIAKTTEEAGEAIQKYIGMTGQNPRKGCSGHLGDVLDELADVAFTAIYAIQHFTKDIELTKGYLMAHQIKAREYRQSVS